jgi:hypothetical protein
MLLHAQTLPRLMLIVAAVVLALVLLLSALNAEVELLLPLKVDAAARGRCG